MASVVGICNRALQKLGANTITDISASSVQARACNLCYETLRDAELQAHKWNFAIDRAELAADSPAPDWGKQNSFTLPSDFLKLADPDPEDNSSVTDYEIEGRKIFTNFSAPLYIRYVRQVTDPNEMDVLFREALACRMAMEMCETLSQSNSKKESLRSDYILAIREARKSNAIARRPQEPEVTSWTSERS